MARAFIGLGSNLGDGLKNLEQAWRRIGQIKGVSLHAISSPYRTEPLGIDTEKWFTNAVGLLETMISCEQLMAALLEVERGMGRDRAKGPDRTVDLDLLFYDDLVYETATIVVPHPEVRNRLFVLAPLAELAPGFVHPVLGKTMRQLLSKVEQSGQKVYKSNW